MSQRQRYRGEAVSRPCHLCFDSRAKYVQLSKVLTLYPLSLISFPWDQRGSPIADYLASILWPIWHSHLLSHSQIHRATLRVCAENVRMKHQRCIGLLLLLLDALCGLRAKVIKQATNKASWRRRRVILGAIFFSPAWLGLFDLSSSECS